VKGPNFFLAGAAKSGTTALWAALRQHPDVYLPVPKESHYYAYLAAPELVRTMYRNKREARRRYRDLYEGAGGQRAIGDASTTNLVVSGAADRIAHDVPGARVVVVLRQPVDRAYAHYRHFVVAGGEDLPSFAEAVRCERARREAGFPFTYQYLDWGRYADQLAPFFERLGRERVLVHLYDAFCDDPMAVVHTTFSFLGVGDDVAVSIGRENEVRGDGDPGPIDPALRAELTAGLEGELRRLEDLLDRDLSTWRT
jgi:hypothetical protein